MISRLMKAAGVALVLAGSLATPALAQKKFDNVTVTIGIIGGPWIDRINAELKDEMAAAGITMKFIGGSSEDILAKLIAAKGQAVPYDVVEIDDQTYADFLKGNFLAKLDLTKIPNLAQLDRTMYDDYKVAYWASEPGIVYNVDKLKAAGIAPPKSYSDLANPALAGRVLLSDINSYMGFYQVLGMAVENGGSEKNPQPGFEMMAKMKPQSYSTSVATTLQLFNAGDVWAAATPVHLGIRMFDAGVNVAGVHPMVAGHKGSLARGYLGISPNHPNPDAAQFFINAVVAQHVQERLYTEASTIPVNNVTMEKVVSKVRVDKAGVPFLQMEPAIVAQTWVPNFADIDRRDWTRQWQRTVAKQSQ